MLSGAHRNLQKWYWSSKKVVSRKYRSGRWLRLTKNQADLNLTREIKSRFYFIFFLVLQIKTKKQICMCVRGEGSQSSGSKSTWAFASVFNMGDQVGHRSTLQMVNEKGTRRSKSFCNCYRGQTPKSQMDFSSTEKTVCFHLGVLQKWHLTFQIH